MTAYWIAHVTVTDPVKYAGYQSLAPAAFAKYGAVFLARGGDFDALEGPDFARHVVIEFPSMADARACYASAEYQSAKAQRDGACTALVTLVDGLR
jgi:uncharacterized protein (DUF1330 family)